MARPARPLPILDEVTIQRFWAMVAKTEEHWFWLGSQIKGYGRFSIGKKYYRAHRISYWLANGELDILLDVDHECQVKLCVKPDHLKQIEPKAHAALSGLRKTKCIHGHELKNRKSRKARYCPTCTQLSTKAYRERIKNVIK